MEREDPYKMEGKWMNLLSDSKGKDFLFQRHSVSDSALPTGPRGSKTFSTPDTSRWGSGSEVSGIVKVLVPSVPLLLIGKCQVLMKLPTLQHPTMVYQLAWASKLAKAFFSDIRILCSAGNESDRSF